MPNKKKILRFIFMFLFVLPTPGSVMVNRATGGERVSINVTACST